MKKIMPMALLSFVLGVAAPLTPPLAHSASDPGTWSPQASKAEVLRAAQQWADNVRIAHSNYSKNKDYEWLRRGTVCGAFLTLALAAAHGDVSNLATTAGFSIGGAFTGGTISALSGVILQSTRKNNLQFKLENLERTLMAWTVLLKRAESHGRLTKYEHPYETQFADELLVKLQELWRKEIFMIQDRNVFERLKEWNLPSAPGHLAWYAKVIKQVQDIQSLVIFYPESATRVEQKRWNGEMTSKIESLERFIDSFEVFSFGKE